MDKTKHDTFFYGYVIVAACFSIQAIGIGTYISYGVFFNSLIAEFGWSRAAIAGASSMAFLFMGLLGIVVGRLNDRIGPRKLMTVTGFFFGLGFLLMSRLGAVWQIYLFYGVVVGIGLSSIDVIPMSTTARWFVRKRGIMTGIAKVGTGAGQFAIPLIASMLIMRYGWRTSYLIIGAAVLILLVAIAQLLKRDPSKIGLLPDGESERSGDNPEEGAGGFSLSEALHTRQFWTICGVSVAIVFCLMSVMVHIVPHAQDIRISAGRAASVLAVIGGVSMAGRFVTGITIDRIGSKRAMICCFGLLIAGLVWLQTAHELWMLYLFAIVYGFAHGGFFTAISPIVAEFFGIRSHGVLFGIVAFSGTVGGAIGPVVTGYIFDVTAAYNLAFWLCALMSAFGLALIVSLKPIKERIGDDLQ
jgi:MFS family permease